MKPKAKPSRPQKSASRPRRPYRTPRLTTYGDVRRLTDAVDTAGLADGGGAYSGMTKT
jgi:hypothetical protein